MGTLRPTAQDGTIGSGPRPRSSVDLRSKQVRLVRDGACGPKAPSPRRLNPRAWWPDLRGATRLRQAVLSDDQNYRTKLGPVGIERVLLQRSGVGLRGTEMQSVLSDLWLVF